MTPYMWLASPQRMMVYPKGAHPMPQNFPADKPGQYPEFSGTPRQQVEALRDLLLNLPRAAEMPALVSVGAALETSKEGSNIVGDASLKLPAGQREDGASQLVRGTRRQPAQLL